MNKYGIAVAGNMVVDIPYKVMGLPGPGELTTIQEIFSRTCGGALCNVIVDLANLDGSLPLTALGRLGEDAEGDYILSLLKKYPNINSANIRRKGITSFTSVMADEITKQRSFFHYRGANAFFSEDDIDWEKINADFLHIGYILLLDTLDSVDSEYGTKMARLLHNAQKRGIKTSIDVVSEKGTRFVTHVPPALKYTDYCIINEFEAEKTTGILLRDDKNNLVHSGIRGALEKLKAWGVSTWTIIHSPEGGFGLDAGNNYEEVPGLKLPDGYIKGTVGAGDAFCSGVIYAAYNGLNLRESLKMGTAAAACSLSEPGSTEGMRSAKDAMALYNSFQ